MRARNDIRCSCPKCLEEERKKKSEEHSVIVECAYCGKKFRKVLSALNKSKSGLYFCCREHKDLAQNLSSDEKFRKMLPPHYGENRTKEELKKHTKRKNTTTPCSTTYRAKAFKYYPNKCAICGYHDDDDTALLDVHHIDSDRNNIDIENLIILCPNCHRKLTSKKYKLIGRDKLEKIKKT
jgi:5-methylcytosine-specific restriction endonuclease McrA